MQEPTTLPAVAGPPANLEAETSIIGSLLIDGDSILRVVQDLKPEHFYGEHNREIYSACCELFGESTGIDQETVRNRLNAKGVLEDIGGDAYLSAAVAQTPHSVHIVDYARIVRSTALLREINDAGARISQIGGDYSNSQDADRALKEAEEIIFKVGRDHDAADFLPIGTARSITEFFEPPTLDPSAGIEPTNRDGVSISRCSARWFSPFGHDRACCAPRFRQIYIGFECGTQRGERR